MGITSVNPATGKPIKTYDEMTPEKAAAAVAQAHETWLTWRTTSFATRARLLKRTAAILRERKQELAQLMAAEMGKPLKQGTAECEKCAWVCDYYAENAEAHLADACRARRVAPAGRQDSSRRRRLLPTDSPWKRDARDAGLRRGAFRSGGGHHRREERNGRRPDRE